MNRFLARVKAYLDRGGARPTERAILEPAAPPPGPAGASRPSALDTLDGHFGDARALVDAGRGRHAVDTETRLMSAVPAAAPGPLLASGPDIRSAINVALLLQVLEHITTYPKMWDQHTWWTSNECGTSGCVAGWTVYFAVPGAVVDEDDEVREQQVLLGSVCNVAAVELGLTATQTAELFNQHNRLRDLWTLAAQYTRGEITVPDELPDGS